MIFFCDQPSWAVDLEPNGFADKSDMHLEYQEFDGRTMRASGKAGIIERSKTIDAYIYFHPTKSKQAIEAKCSGFLRYMPAFEQFPEMIGVAADLTPVLWSGVWEKAVIAPHSRISFFVGQDEFAKIQTGKPIPIFDIWVQLSFSQGPT